jgi:F-type H+-transporting ATPase subunit gamma
METLQSLQKRIITTGKLQSIVKSMKTLSAVSVRQYERAVASLGDYLLNIESGLQVALRDYKLPVTKKASVTVVRGLIVFGSDQGLCGRFNENLVALFEKQLQEWHVEKNKLHVLVIGARIAARLDAIGHKIDEQFWVPGSVSGINHNIYQILLVMERWQKQYQLTHIDMFFNRHAPGSAGEPYTRALLPIDNVHLRHVAEKKWEGRSLPQYSVQAPQLFFALIQQYLFVSLFRAQAESLESEHASRLRSMQNAEKNIQEHLEELQAKYSAERQSSITSELLDLVAGFKTAAGKKKDKVLFDPALLEFLSGLEKEIVNA